MADREPQFSKADAVLVLTAALLGLAAASAFGAYQAVNGDDGALRDFAVNVAWPGVQLRAEFHPTCLRFPRPQARVSSDFAPASRACPEQVPSQRSGAEPNTLACGRMDGHQNRDRRF